MTNTAPTPAAQIVLFDHRDANGVQSVEVEMRAANPGDKDSMSNLLVAWMAANWDELFVLFRRQLTAHKDEAGEVKQTTPVRSVGPRLIAADGKTVLSSEASAPVQLGLFDDVPQADIELPAFVTGGGGDFGGGGADASYDASPSSTESGTVYDSYSYSSDSSSSCDSSSSSSDCASD